MSSHQRVVTVGTATISASVDGQQLDSTLEIKVAQLEDLVDMGIEVIDCSNYLDFKDLNLLIKGGTVAFNSDPGCSPMHFGSLRIEGGGVLTHSKTTPEEAYRLDIVVSDITITHDGSIDAAARGYEAGYWLGNTTEGASENRAGGSHGGLGHRGDLDSDDQASMTYGVLDSPDSLGAGAGPTGACAQSNCGGKGGGLVRIRVKEGGFFVLNGLIDVSGSSTGYRGGGGAGGSVRIDTPHMSGSGSIVAVGGDGFDNVLYRGGGGGGPRGHRVAWALCLVRGRPAPGAVRRRLSQGCPADDPDLCERWPGGRGALA